MKGPASCGKGCAALSTWRETLPAERIKRIDTLTYILGKYHHYSASTRSRSGEIRSRKTTASKSKRLDALSSGTSRTPRSTCTSPPSSHCDASVRPHTDRAEARELAKIWLRHADDALQRSMNEEAKEETQQTAHLLHPPQLFTDESFILRRFGMLARVSPSPGDGPMEAIFRQTWRDFHVTEMVLEGEDAVPLSRHFSFTVPPIPASLLTPPERPFAVDGHTRANFFQVDVKESLRAIRKEEPHSVIDTEGHDTTPSSPVSKIGEQSRDGLPAACGSGSGVPDISKGSADSHGRFYLQCTLHKQHVPHSVALSELSQVLRIHPRDISVSGIKDFIGDTVQRVRLANVSPASALQANSLLARKKARRIQLSDFSYHTEPLQPGNLFGNRFKITLRDVTAPKEHVEEAMHNFHTFGFPNYYGCQRFSWFGGVADPAFALLRHNWLVFAFRFLNYTDSYELSLRALLQRERKYPHPVQDQYRRGVVRRLRRLSIDPADLDTAPFLSCPSLDEPLCSAHGGPISQVQELILLQLREAFFDLEPQSRRLTAQKLSSYCWNQALSLRLHHFGGSEVLLGDFAAPSLMRQLVSDREGRQDYYHHTAVVTEGNRTQYTIADVLHPGFSFDGIALPDNAVGDYYKQVCGKYQLDWNFPHSRHGLRDFREPLRPIVRFPINLTYDYRRDSGVLVVEFSLERGCYANVALTELLGHDRCLGSDKVLLLPLPGALWEGLGERDRGYVTSLQDVYDGFEDGLGFTGDVYTTPHSSADEGAAARVWDHEGPLFLPESKDPKVRAFKWGSTHLLRNMTRRIQDLERQKRVLFECPLANTLTEEEAAQYVGGHTVPLLPNAKKKKIFFKVTRRRNRYAGAPRPQTRFSRKHYNSSSRRQLPSFQSLNKNSWNVSW